MNNSRKVFIVLVIAGMFLLPPAAVASSGEQGVEASDAKQSDPVSEYPPTSLAVRTNLAAQNTGQTKAAVYPGTKVDLEHPEIFDPEYGPRPLAPGRGPRAGPDCYVAAFGLSIISPPDVEIWNGPGVYAKKGADTQFNITINNTGDADASAVLVTVIIWDYFGAEMKNETQTVNSIPQSTNATVYFHWTPAYCTYFELNITINAPGDTNLANDQVDVWHNGYAMLGVAVWADSCTSLTGYTGDIGGNNKWHITTSPFLDNATQHTADGSQYEGSDITNQYARNSNLALRSPQIDLRNFGKSYFLHFNYLFHGGMPAVDAGDYLEQAFSTNNGATWGSPFARMDGPGLAGAVTLNIDWFNWYTDLNGDGNAQGNEVGLEISEVAGETMSFRSLFVSNQAIEDTGIYMDDFCIWGIEVLSDVGVDVTTDYADMHVGVNLPISAKVTNTKPKAQPSPFNCTLNITKRGDPTHMLATFPVVKPVNALAGGASQTIDFNWVPTEVADFVITVNITGAKDEDSYNNRVRRMVHVSGASPSILIVNDNPSEAIAGTRATAFNTTDIIINTLVSAGYTDYAVYNSTWKGSLLGVDIGGDGPSSTILNNYEVVIWTTGWDTKNWTNNGTLTANDQTNLKTYLNGAGSLWLISFGAINDLGTNTFSSQQLHIKAARNDTQIKGSANSGEHILPDPINGTAGSIAEGKSYKVIPHTGTDWTDDNTDLVQPDASAQGMFFGNASLAPGDPWYVGVQYAGAYRVVFQTFDLSFLFYPNDRTEYTKAVLGFLMGGLAMEVGGQIGTGPLKQMVDPGGTAVFTLYINNSGAKERLVENITLDPVTAGWTAVVDPEVQSGDPSTSVKTGETLEITVTVTAPPRALAGDRADLGLNVTFKGYSVPLFNRTITEVRAIVKAELVAANTVQNLTGAGSASYPFTVRNLGNLQVIAELQRTGEHFEWLQLSIQSVLLNAYEEKNLTAMLSVPEGAYRQAGNYTLITTLTSRVNYQDKSSNSTLNLTTNIRVAQVFSAKIDDVELTPSDGQVDMSVAKPSAKVSVKVSSAKGNGYDNISVELKSKSFAPITATGIGPSRSWDGAGWNLPKTVVDATPFMTVSKEGQLTVFVPPKADAGEYSIEVRAIPGSGKTTDGDTTTVVVKVTKPDLTLGTLSFSPKEPEVGTTVKLKVLVKNIGGAKAKDVDVAFYGSGDNLIETKNLAELGAGGSQNVEIEWTGFVEGENQITVRVDPDSKLSETTRDNNELAETLVGLRSDLQIDGAPIFKVGGVVKTSVRSGDTLQVEVTIKNMGTWGVNMTEVVVKLTDQTTNDVLTERISSLPTRSDAKVTFNWVARKDGTHTITVKVNPDGLIREKDLNNNEATGTIKVVTPKPPDGEFSMMTLAAIGGIIAVVAIIAALMMMRKKSPPAPYSAPVSTPPEETVAVVAEEVPPPGADQGRK